MKRFMGMYWFGILLSVLAVVAVPRVGFGERGTLPPGDSTVYTKDLSTTNLPATYGAAGNSYATGLSGKSGLCLYNTSATKIYGTTSTVSNCTGGANKWVVPAGGGACFDYTKLNSNVCLRSASGTISSGIVDVVIW